MHCTYILDNQAAVYTVNNLLVFLYYNPFYWRKRGYFDHNNVPKECILIKAGIRGRKPGCDCIWELTRQQDLALLEKMFRLLDYRKAHRNYFFKKFSFCFFA